MPDESVGGVCVLLASLLDDVPLLVERPPSVSGERSALEVPVSSDCEPVMPAGGVSDERSPAAFRPVAPGV